jgi:hypothetical protein
MIGFIKNKIYLFIFVFVISIYPIYAEGGHPTVVFQNVFFSTKTASLVHGNYEATANICSEQTVLWSEKLPINVTFNYGNFDIILGRTKDIPIDIFNNPTLNFLLEIPNDAASFSISSIPYSIQSKIAENALRGLASRVTGNFTSTVNIDANLFSGNQTKRLLVDIDKRLVGIGKITPNYILNVSGYINIPKKNTGIGYLINEADISTLFAWQHQSEPNTNNIYYKASNKPSIVGIQNGIPTNNNLNETKDSAKYALVVNGIVNAEELLVNYGPISQSLAWKKTESPTTRNIYYAPGDVGIGLASPKARLDILNGIKLGSTPSDNSGVIKWSSTDGFQGYKDNKWIDMISIIGVGTTDKIAMWENSFELDSVYRLTWKENIQRLGLGIDSPTARLDIKGDSTTSPFLLGYAIDSTTANAVIYYGNDGKMGIGTKEPGKDWPKPQESFAYPLALQVKGRVNATFLKVDGVSINKKYKRGTLWVLNPQNDSLYYNRGHVGIGRPDPGKVNFQGPNPLYLDEEIGNTLEIAAPNKYPDQPTSDPAITFSTHKDNQLLHNYTMGIDADKPEIFRIEKSSKLGTETPLFVLYKQQLGIGVEEPKANLHVYGSLGSIMTGIPEIITKNAVDGPGTRFMWVPSKSGLRVGRLRPYSDFGDDVWNWDYIGKSTIAMGADPVATGNYATVLGGNKNRAGGAYATVIGGAENSAYGDFSLAIGKKAKALHHGTFVWADGQQDTNFKTQMENQFLVFAIGGVGIGTANTRLSDEETRVGLVLATNNYTSNETEYLLKAFGPTNNISNIFAISTSGNVMIGTSNVPVTDNTKLVVISGNVGIGTINPSADLHIITDIDSTYGFLAIGVEDSITSPAMVVTNSGNVGIGMVPETKYQVKDEIVVIRGSGFVQVASGDIAATSFIFPDGQKISTGGAVIVWSWSEPIRRSAFSEIHVISKNVSAQQQIWDALRDDGYLDTTGAITAKFDPLSLDPIFTTIANNLDIQPVNVQPVEIHSILKRIKIAQGDNNAPPSPNLSFTSGNVGIGTISPNSLLELSNFGSELIYDPIITFDMFGSDTFSMGIKQAYPDVFRIESGGSSTFGQVAPPFSIKGDYVGIGTSNPEANLHVKGNVLLNNKARINTANTSAKITSPINNLNKLYIQGDDNTAGGVKWFQSGPPTTDYKIWYDNVVNANSFVYIGIGTSNPQAHLHIPGTISVQTPDEYSASIIMRSKLITPLLDSYGLKFRDRSAGDTPLMKLSTNTLLLVGAGKPVNISDVFSYGEGPGGYIAMWPPQPGIEYILSPTLLYWDDTNTELGMTCNIAFSHNYNDKDIFTAQNNIIIGTGTIENMGSNQTNEIKPLLSIRSEVSRGISEFDAKSHSGKAIKIELPDIAPTSEEVSIKALNIEISQPENVFLKNSARAVALNIDMSAIDIIPGDNQLGYKYAAIFKSGVTANVGVNKVPEVALDVAGTVSANRFVITDRLSITTLNVKQAAASLRDPSLHVFSSDKVGIGTSEPKTTLEIIGGGDEVLVADNARTNGFKSDSMSIHNGKLIVAGKKVGMGTSAPIAQWEINKIVNSRQDILDNQFTSQKIIVSNNVTILTKDSINALDIKIKTELNNKIGPQDNDAARFVKGLNIDLSQLYTTQNTLVGIDVNVVSKNADNVSQNAAVFYGNVGIGETQPNYPLVVKGTIHANSMLNIILGGDQHAAEFNQLTNRSSTANNLIGQDLYISGNVFIEKLIIPNDDLLLKYDLASYQEIRVPDLFASTSNITTTTDAKEVAANYVSANIGLFDVVGINTLSPSQRLDVQGSMLTNYISGTPNITAGILLANNGLIVVSNNSKVGIKTDPVHKLSILTEPNLGIFEEIKFNEQDNSSWYAIRIQTNTGSKNIAAGIRLTPRTSDDIDQSSGIVAIRSDDAPVTGSHLAFISVPNNGSSTEYMRLTSEGLLGLGTSEPSSNLHVTDRVLIDTDFIATTSFQIANIKSTGMLTITSTLNVPTTLNTVDLALNALKLKPIETVKEINGWGTLHVSTEDKKLYYLTIINGNQIVSGDLRATVDLSAQIPTYSIPFYSSGYDIKGSAFKWVTSNRLDIFQLNTETTIASGNAFSNIENNIPSNDIYNDFTAQLIRFGLKKRTDAYSSVFSGVSINIEQNNEFLAEDDAAVGLLVNFDKRLTKADGYHLDDGTLVSGKQYTAYFLANSKTDSYAKTSGNVGIATSPNNSIFHPLAELHVSSNVAQHSGFQIDILKTDLTTIPALVVSANGHIGIGTSLPTAKLTIKASDSSTSNSALNVIHNDNSVLFVRNDNRLGIGTTSPQTRLEVIEHVSANSLILNTLNSSEARVNMQNDGFIVNNEGFVGIGVSTPESQFHFRETLTDPTNKNDFSLEIVDFTLIGGQNITKNLTGLNLSLASSENYNWFSGLNTEEEQNRAKGLFVDLTELALVTNNSLIGINVSLPKDKNYNQYQSKLLKSAIFLGGNVGIGLTNPAYALDVKGEIKAVDFVVDESFVFSNVETATFNRVIITTNAVIDTLYVKNTDPSIEILNDFFINEDLEADINWTATNKALYLQDIFSQTASLNSLRISTSNNYWATLNIDQNVQISKAVSIDSFIKLKEIASDSDIHFTVSLNITPTAQIFAGAIANKATFEQMPTPTLISGYGTVFLSNIDNSIYYINESLTVDLGGRSLGTEGKVPFFDSLENLSDNNYLDWSLTNYANNITYNVLAVGAANTLNSFKNSNFVALEQFNAGDALSTQLVNIVFQERNDRSQTYKPIFTGVSINMTNNNNASYSDNDEKYAGIYVDVTNLKTQYRREGMVDTIFQGKKYAAVFLANGNQDRLPDSLLSVTPSFTTSTNVGIVTNADENYDLAAQLHVIGKKHGASRPDLNGLSIESRFISNSQIITRNALIVSTNGQMAIGPETPSAQLSISSFTSDQIPFSILSRSNNTLLSINNNNYLGIGTNTPSSYLTLLNSDTENKALIIDVTSSNPTVVDNTGKIGIGTSEPSANFHVYYRPNYYFFTPTLYLFDQNDPIFIADGEDNPPDGLPDADNGLFLRSIRYWYRGEWRYYGYGYFTADDGVHPNAPLSLYDKDAHTILSYTIDSYMEQGAENGIVAIPATIFDIETPSLQYAMTVSTNANIALGRASLPSPSIPLQVGGFIYTGQSDTSLIEAIPGQRPIYPNWVAKEVYNFGDRVVFDNKVWICVNYHLNPGLNSNWTPSNMNDASNTYWEIDTNIDSDIETVQYGLINKTSSGYSLFSLREETAFQTWKRRKVTDTTRLTDVAYYIYGELAIATGNTVPQGTLYSDLKVSDDQGSAITLVSGSKTDTNTIIQWGNRYQGMGNNKDPLIFQSGKDGNGVEVMRITYSLENEASIPATWPSDGGEYDSVSNHDIYNTLFGENDFNLLVGIGTTDPETTLDINANSSLRPALWVGLDNEPNVLSYDGTYGDELAFTESGTTTITDTIPDAFLAEQSFGSDVLLKGQITAGNPYQVYLAKDGSTKFIIWAHPTSNNQFYHKVDGAGNLQFVYGQVDNDTADEVDSDEITNTVFSGISYLTPSQPDNSFVIDSTGKIGFNTGTPQELVQVNGTTNASSLVVYPGVGTHMIINEAPEEFRLLPNLLISTTRSCTDNFVITSVHNGFLDEAIGESIIVSIENQDLNGNLGAGLSGVSLNLSGQLSTIGRSEDIPFIGINVDVSDLNIKDPSDITMDDGTPVGWNDKGDKYAAAFLGGHVGIGIASPDARLHVLPLQTNGKVPEVFTAAIPIARFAQEESKDFLEIFALGTQNAYEEITSMTFTCKPGVTHIESMAIFESLLEDGILKRLIQLNMPGGPTSLPNGGPTGTDIEFPVIGINLPARLIGKVIANPAVAPYDSDNWGEYTLPRFQIDPNDPSSPYMNISSITTKNVMRIVESHKHKGIITFKSGFSLSEGSDNGSTFMYLTSGQKSFNTGYIESDLESTGNVEEIFSRTNSRLEEGSPGAMGIYIATPSATLHIDGEARIGSVTESISVASQGGSGKLLHFSGGPALGINDSDNNDPIWMGRYNVKTIGRQGTGITELFVNFGDEGYNPNSRFLVRTSLEDSIYSDLMASPNFAVRCFGFVEGDQPKIAPRGMVGVATGNPIATLHVFGSSKDPMIPYFDFDDDDDIDDDDREDVDGNNVITADDRSPLTHLVCIEDADETMAGLAIRYTTPVGYDANYISFLVPSGNPDTEEVHIIGAIEGASSDGSKIGVRFSSPQADYAEYLPKLNKKEVLEKADIVGVFGGKVTKTTTKADQIMVVSSAPLVIGNWPGSNKDHEYSQIAFLGQVQVKIKGAVKAGDFIIPSGSNDGLGIAVSANNVSAENIDSILGIAWETSNKKNVKNIKVLIGFPSSITSLLKEIGSIANIRKEIDTLRKDNKFLVEKYTSKLDDRQRKIDLLRTDM